MSAKQSPPIPVMCGSTTHSTAAAATAASAAVPPSRSVSIAASVASGCDVAAIAWQASTGERPGNWKSRFMGRLRLLHAVKTRPGAAFDERFAQDRMARDRGAVRPFWQSRGGPAREGCREAEETAMQGTEKSDDGRGTAGTNLPPFTRPRTSGFGLRLQYLAALVHARLEVDVVRSTQFAGILVLDISRPLERIGGTAHAATRRGDLLLRHSHGQKLLRVEGLEQIWARRGAYRGWIRQRLVLEYLSTRVLGSLGLRFMNSACGATVALF